MRITLLTHMIAVEGSIPEKQNPERWDEAELDRLINTLQVAKAWLKKHKLKETK